jgi:hypothetical protein
LAATFLKDLDGLLALPGHFVEHVYNLSIVQDNAFIDLTLFDRRENLPQHGETALISGAEG